MDPAVTTREASRGTISASGKGRANGVSVLSAELSSRPSKDPNSKKEQGHADSGPSNSAPTKKRRLDVSVGSSASGSSSDIRKGSATSNGQDRWSGFNSLSEVVSLCEKKDKQLQGEYLERFKKIEDQLHVYEEETTHFQDEIDWLNDQLSTSSNEKQAMEDRIKHLEEENASLRRAVDEMKGANNADTKERITKLERGFRDLIDILAQAEG